MTTPAPVPAEPELKEAPLAAEQKESTPPAPKKPGPPRRYVREEDMQALKGGFDKRLSGLATTVQKQLEAMRELLEQQVYGSDPEELSRRRSERQNGAEAGRRVQLEMRETALNLREKYGVPSSVLDGADDQAGLHDKALQWLHGQRSAPAGPEEPEETPPPPEKTANPGSGPGAAPAGSLRQQIADMESGKVSFDPKKAAELLNQQIRS